MPSRSSVTLGLASALLGGVTSYAWAESSAESPEVSIAKDAGWVAQVEPYLGKAVTFLVAEGWDPRGELDCAELVAGTNWTFEVQDSDGSGALDTTHLPGFALRAPGVTLSVTDAQLSGWCVEGTAADPEAYAHLISDDAGVKITLTGIGLGQDNPDPDRKLTLAGIYGLAGTVQVVDQHVVGLGFPAAQILGATFIQTGGSYVTGGDSAIRMSAGTVSLSGVSFVSGSAERGVGVDALGGVLLVFESSFEGGTATIAGGAIAAQDTIVNLDNVKLRSNVAPLGGGLWAQGGLLTIKDGEFSGNVASDRGGAVFVDQVSEATITDSSFTGNGAPLGGGLSARSVERLEVSEALFDGDTASLKGGGLHLTQVNAARLCGLTLSEVTATVSGGALYATDSTITLGADDGSCAASQISGAVAPEGAALSFFDTSDAPDDVGLSAVGLQLSQLNPNSEDGDDRRITQDEAIYASTSGALSLSGLSTPGGMGDLALLTAIEGEVSLIDVEVLDAGTTSYAQFVAVQQSVIELTRPASVDVQGLRICGFIAEGDSTGSLDMLRVDAPVGDVLIAQSVLFGADAFGALLRVLPDDSGRSDAAVTLRHNTLIGAKKEFQDGAKIDAGSVLATGNLLSRLDVGLTLTGLRASGQGGAAEIYNLFSESVSTPLNDEDGRLVRVHESSTDKVKSLDLVPAFTEISCATLPELLESSPAVNGGDPEGARDPDGSIADQGALPTTLEDSDDDGSFDVDDCAPDDPTLGDTLDEIYGDGLDNDCDPGTLDDDQDGDGLLRGTDCDDTDPTPCPLVNEYSGGRAACDCASAPGAMPAAPRRLWLAPLLLALWRRRRRQGC